MCGRLNQLELFEFVGLKLKSNRRKKKEREDKRAWMRFVYNICPTDYADVLTLDGEGLAIERMRFGLIPKWAKGGKKEVWKKFMLTFNARCETVFEKSSFRGPIRRQRCLVPVTGWHEWPERTTPYYIHRADGGPLLLGGIWDEWESSDPSDEETGAVVTSMSVITTPPGRYMAKFHDRSPLVLDEEGAEAWLQPGLSDDDIKALIQPYDKENLEAYRVAMTVNKATHKGEDVTQAIEPPVPHE